MKIIKILKNIVTKPYQCIEHRASLNLPKYNGNFPFRPKQKEALELILSDAPVVMITGNTGSGKTEIAIAAINVAIANGCSVLVVGTVASQLEKYRQSNQLLYPPLFINEQEEYRKLQKNWVQEQINQSELTFIPRYLLEDKLFEELQHQPNRQYWINGIREGDQYKIKQMITKIFPQISPIRLHLLIHRVCQSLTLLEHRERLEQTYKHLSDQAIEEISEVLNYSSVFPIICSNSSLKNALIRDYDLVIVEDSHYLDVESIELISKQAKKLALIGEPIIQNNNNKLTILYKKLSRNLLPAYRIELQENYRLHPAIAHQVFSAFYKKIPYTAPKYVRGNQDFSNTCLQWYDCRTSENLLDKIEQKINEFSQNHKKQELPKILTFSVEICQILKIKFGQHNNLTIHHVKDWVGCECSHLWIIDDASKNADRTLADFHIALTRAKESITIFADWEYFDKKSSQELHQLFSIFQRQRDIDLDLSTLEHY